MDSQDWIEQLDMRAILSQIDRDRAEMLKLAAETERLQAQAHATKWITALIIAGSITGALVLGLSHL